MSRLHWYAPRRVQGELWSGQRIYDCGWDWLSVRSYDMRLVPLGHLFGKLCDHVHTPHGKDH
jgi:hypothetical protein